MERLKGATHVSRLDAALIPQTPSRSFVPRIKGKTYLEEVLIRRWTDPPPELGLFPSHEVHPQPRLSSLPSSLVLIPLRSPSLVQTSDARNSSLTQSPVLSYVSGF